MARDVTRLGRRQLLARVKELEEGLTDIKNDLRRGYVISPRRLEKLLDSTEAYDERQVLIAGQEHVT
jgi:hypothetical protein